MCKLSLYSSQLCQLPTVNSVKGEGQFLMENRQSEIDLIICKVQHFQNKYPERSENKKTIGDSIEAKIRLVEYSTILF